MRPIALSIILFLIVACRRTSTTSELLSSDIWIVDKIENIRNGELVPEALIEGATFIFKSDNTAIIEVQNDYRNSVRDVTWILKGNSILIVDSNDTSQFAIELLTENNLTITLSIKGDSLRFYLTSGKTD